MKNSFALINTQNEAGNVGNPLFSSDKPEGRLEMAPRQKPPRTAHPDLYHLISREGYFRTRRRSLVAETDEQDGCAAD